ncbi:hypothetical protein NZD89_15750 [Alicyclobacillus fastidiosus]|uniref:Uncharacterized protein n=1 Tax=Alicyclobacillus fastidiosus TaxID=392011 RepID=A0ABY6ZAE5_9BACL|nr:hypothetical protein [Alicyclobacillus fastidiosus]WAH39855.1 hypothetical protein NZD89_15750 [Alicyclobacillus fastidiosus]
MTSLFQLNFYLNLYRHTPQILKAGLQAVKWIPLAFILFHCAPIHTDVATGPDHLWPVHIVFADLGEH